MLVLKMIEEGRITADEGLNLLQMLNGEVEHDQPDQDSSWEAANQASTQDTARQAEEEIPGPIHASTAAQQPAKPPDPGETTSDPAPEILKWKRWWMVPLWIGVGFIVFGGTFMYLAQQSAGIGLWFLCATLPFALGLVLIVLAYQSRTAPWLHLRIQQRPGQKPERLAFSFPVPLRQAAWLSRVFGDRIPGMSGQDLEHVIQAVGTTATPENPIFIQVDEGARGEKVEIYLG